MNKHEIIRAIELSAIAYQEVQPDNCSIFKVVDDKASDIYFILRQSGDFLHITFRGSNSLKDWKTDLTFWKQSIPYDNMRSAVRVHSGFLSAYKNPQIRGYILKNIAPGIKKICITGHSYGAALAVLCAVDIAYNFPQMDIEVVTFGCPRVGNRAWKKSYNKRVHKTVRVENGNDIVTKLPFGAWGFRHVGARLHVGTTRVLGLFSFTQHGTSHYYSSILSKLL